MKENLLRRNQGPYGEGLGEGLEEKNIHKKHRIPECLKNFARELRRKQSDAEAFIWQSLKNRHISKAKFRRQHPVGYYILDFYCHEVKLAIELDGSQHFEKDGLEKDEVRSRVLETMGIRVIRFDNGQVFKEKENILQEIFEVLSELRGKIRDSHPDPHPSPLPKGEGAKSTVHNSPLAGEGVKSPAINSPLTGDQSPSPSGRRARDEG